MTIVVDASVAAKWFIQEVHTPEAEALQRAEEAIAPDLVVAEVLNTIWKNIRLGRIAVEQIELVAAALPMRFSTLVPLTPLAARAGEIAHALDHPIYDAFYIALAERERCAFVTADDRLQRKARGTPFAKFVTPLLAKR